MKKLELKYRLTVSGPRSESNKGDPWYIDPVKTSKEKHEQMS